MQRMVAAVAGLPHRVFVIVGLVAVAAGFGLEGVDLAMARFDVNAAWLIAVGAFLSTVVGAAREAERELQTDHDGDGVPLKDDPDEWPALGKQAVAWVMGEIAENDGAINGDLISRLCREANRRFAEPRTVAPLDSEGRPTG